MKRQIKAGGYTIVEVMIFLGVSGGLLAIAMLLLSGQQGRQQFTQSIRDTDSKIQDIINDVNTGYFPNTDNFGCMALSSGGPPIPNKVTSQEQGKHLGCSFIGKVVQFAPDGTNGEGMKLITVVGRQFVHEPLSDIVENLVEAKPVPLIGHPVDTSEDIYLSYGLRVKSITYTNNSNSEVPIGAIGFFSSFSNSSGSDVLSGKQSTQMVVIPNSALGQNNGEIRGRILDIGSLDVATLKNQYINRPVTICFVSGSSNQHGIIKIGGNKDLTTALSIEEGSACP